MDQSSAPALTNEATPIFGAYRRGYDPVQVDRYVAEQQRRLDDATGRASEAERKLAAAVGQLRELHRRVAVLESEDRSQQPAPLDALGERVQRILQEAWEGAYALRQQAETETAAVRERAAGDAAETIVGAEQRAAEIVAEAERRAAAIDAEIERRRVAWNARLEEDRAKAVAQLEHLHRQRNDAVSELLRLRAMIEKAVGDLGAGGVGEIASSPAPLEPLSCDVDDADSAPSSAAAEVILTGPAPAAAEPGACSEDGPEAAPGGAAIGTGEAVLRTGLSAVDRRGDPPVRLQRPLRPRRVEAASAPSPDTACEPPHDVASAWTGDLPGTELDAFAELDGAGDLTSLVPAHRSSSDSRPEPAPRGVFDFEEEQL